MDTFEDTHVPPAVNDAAVIPSNRLIRHLLGAGRSLGDAFRGQLSIVAYALHALHTRFILFNLPTYYSQSAVLILPSSSTGGDLDGGVSFWNTYHRDLTIVAGSSAIQATIITSLLQTSFGSSNNVVFACGIIALIFASIAAVFCVTYYVLMRYVRLVDARWIQSRDVSGGRLLPSPNSSVILALPVAWQAWTMIASLVFFCMGVLLAKRECLVMSRWH